MLTTKHGVYTMATGARVVMLSVTRPLSTHVSGEAAKPYSELPGMRIYPGIGSAPAFIRGRSLKGQMHEFMQSMHLKHGSIYKFGLGGYRAVAIHDPADVKEVLRKEGNWPSRGDVISWDMALDEIGEEKGILISQGEKWQRLRSSVTKDMMRPRCVAVHTDKFRQVADDMVARLVKSRDSEHVVPSIRDDLFKWAFESSCTVLLERRLGLLGEDTPQESLDFITTMIDILNQTEKLSLLPPKLVKALRLPLWSSFTDNWRHQYRIGKKYIDEALADVMTKGESGETKPGLIAALTSESNLSNREMYALMLDLMNAAVDTTSNTTCLLLDLLSRHPEVQEKLYQEVMSVTCGEQLTYEHIQNMPYMKAVLKETMRMYPLVIFLPRVLKEDLVLRGYNIPKDTMLFAMTYNTGRDPSLFPRPEEFRPERWLRSQKDRDHINPYASLPFGFGKRACVGRRIAELEMYILTASILRRFRLASTTEGPIQVIMTSLLRHKNSPRIQFLDRLS